MKGRARWVWDPPRASPHRILTVQQVAQALQHSLDGTRPESKLCPSGNHFQRLLPPSLLFPPSHHALPTLSSCLTLPMPSPVPSTPPHKPAQRLSSPSLLQGGLP